MTDTPATATATATTTGSPSPAPSSTPASTPTSTSNSAPAVNDRSRGYSPAMDAREQQTASHGAEPMIRVGDQDFAEKDIRDALGARAEAELRKSTLPSSPDGYELKLPADFRAPEGLKFEWDNSDPVLAQARQMAHARGLDQDTFSSLLGLYAADKIGTQMQLANARNVEIQKLGSAASARISQVETWLRARVGSDADVIVNQIRAFPHAGMVRAFEKIVAQFSNQGGVDFSQSGRVHESPQGKIAGYDGMSFAQRRVAQMSATTGRGEKR